MSGPLTRPAAPEPQGEKRGSFLPILLALGGAFAVLTALLFLTLGLFAYVVAAGLVLFLLAGFHYLVWGRWLERVIRAQVDDEDRLERERVAKDAIAMSNAQADEQRFESKFNDRSPSGPAS